jgi:hypothetical protein
MASDSRVGSTIRHELGNVLRANEDRFELAAQGRDKCAIAGGAYRKSGVRQQLTNFFDQPPLVWQRYAEH